MFVRITVVGVLLFVLSCVCSYMHPRFVSHICCPKLQFGKANVGSLKGAGECG